MALVPNVVFEQANEKGASDVHLVVGSPIVFRIDGELKVQGVDPVTPYDAEKFVRSLLGAERYHRLEETREIDVSYSISNGVRMRVNCHFERGNHGLAARIIPQRIPALAEINLDEEIVKRLCGQQDGLILFTGPTGTGKSTSLAAMIKFINDERPAHIITLEDPIEFVLPPGKGLIRQREYYADFISFPEALKRVLRQDPDIVMVGEMRDLETISAALTLAETGHLVFATLHTPNAVQTVDRIVDVFPPHQQRQIRTQLSMSLKAIVAQRLLPKVGGGRVAQREILINTHAIANIIRESRTPELLSALQTGGDVGMVTFQKDAERLFKEGLIDQDAYEMGTVRL